LSLTMTAIKNAGGPLAPGRDYHYVGGRTPDYSLAKLTPLPGTF
jgi:hypothetical protein